MSFNFGDSESTATQPCKNNRLEAMRAKIKSRA